MRRAVVFRALASLALLAAGAGFAAAFDLTMKDTYTWRDYQADFPEKRYADAAEAAMREAIFERRVAEIKHHNTHLAGKTKRYRKVRACVRVCGEGGSFVRLTACLLAAGLPMQNANQTESI